MRALVCKFNLFLISVLVNNFLQSFIMKKIISILFLLVAFNALAQDNYTLYNMRMVPQSHYLNPSFMPQQKVYVGISPINIPIIPILPIPVASSIYFSKGNSGPRLIDFLLKDGDTTVINLDNAIKRAAKTNYLNLNTSIDILSFGFKVKKNYFTFNATNKIFTSFRYPKDILTLLNEGNGGANIGKELNFNFGLNANIYNEIALGYMRELLEEKLWVGGKIKLYQGIANVQTKRSDFKLLTGDTAYEWNVDADAQINLAGAPASIADSNITDDFVSQASSFGNMGLGIDLGATYRVNDKITASASIIDLGFINYRNYVANYNFKGSFRFSGVDVMKFIGKDSTDTTQIGEAIIDSIQNSFNGTTTSNSYKQWMPAQIYIQGTYKINDYFTAGGLLHTQFYNNRPHLGGSLSMTTQIKKWLNASVAYNMYNRSFGNLGLGLGFNVWFMQTYIMADNVLAFMSYSRFGTSDGGAYSGYSVPTGFRNINFRVGCNWTFGRKPRDKDKDGILDKADKCPDVKGSVELNGCPDKDGDKVADAEDRCPDVAGKTELSGCPDQDNDGVTDLEDACPSEAGLKETKGCPDKDGDGIKDAEDECPGEAGMAELKGCPDKDEDGIADKNDQCPDIKGTEAFSGCPDTDNDGISDDKDLCPEIAGPKDNKGCPYKDTDKDGVLDKDDKCMDQPGPAENKGCPLGDADGDGVTDNKDQCPNTAGPADNNGCPRIEKVEQEKLNTIFANIEFETAMDVLKESCFDELNELATLLNKKPEWRLVIEGHTDNVGNPKSNLTLSQKRSESIVKYLVNKGIDIKRLIPKGYGDKKPIATNKTEEGRTRNRRVEMKVMFE